MQNKDFSSEVAQTSTQSPRRERVGLVVSGTDAASAASMIVAAEAAGVRQVRCYLLGVSCPISAQERAASLTRRGSCEWASHAPTRSSYPGSAQSRSAGSSGSSTPPTRSLWATPFLRQHVQRRRFPR